MDFFKPHFWRAIITFPLWKIWVLFLFGASYLLLSIHVTYILNSMLLFSLNLRSRAEYHDTLNKNAKCKLYGYIPIYSNPAKSERISFCLTDHLRSPSRSGHLHLWGAPEFRTAIDQSCACSTNAELCRAYCTLNPFTDGIWAGHLWDIERLRKRVRVWWRRWD